MKVTLCDPHGLYSPWNSPGQNTGVGSLSLIQGIFPTQGSNQVSHIAGRFFTIVQPGVGLWWGLNKYFNIQKTKIITSGPITSWQIDGETVDDFILLGSKSLQMVIAAMKLKDAYSLEGKL